MGLTRIRSRLQFAVWDTVEQRRRAREANPAGSYKLPLARTGRAAGVAGAAADAAALVDGAPVARNFEERTVATGELPAVVARQCPETKGLCTRNPRREKKAFAAFQLLATAW